MANDYYIRFQDPALAMGGQIATTGETKEEYNKRLNLRIALAQTDFNPYVLKDKEFVTTLPFSIQAEWTTEWDKDNKTANFNNSYDVFIENLKASFGDDLANNAAVVNELKIEEESIYRKMHTTELCTTEVGGNDAINCYWAFNENDDIIYPTNALDPKTCTLGLGRVYADMYQRKQVILWMTFGVPEYSGIWEFYTKAYNASMASELHSGVLSSAAMAGRAIGGLFATAVKIATLPWWVINNIGKIFVKYTITKYCELRTTMPQYYKVVNDLMSTVAVNMGIQRNNYIDDKDSNTEQYNASSLPGMMKYGLDIYRIMAKRAIYTGAYDNKDMSKLNAEEIYKQHNKAWDSAMQSINPDKFENKEFSAGSGSWLGNVADAIMAHGTGSTAYIGFKVEKSVDASESISNSTGESELKGILNSGVEAREKVSFMTQGGKLGASDSALGAAQALMGKVSDFANGLIGSFDVGGLTGLVTGTGHYDIPEVWKDSSFSTSYSFRTQLVSHYADRVSIFQNCYVPMFCLLAAALPRQVGNNTYIQPFFCRAYCQGRFAVSYGIIDSMSIKRGSDEFGWTEEGFPTVIDISWSIKDLSPLVFLSLDSGIISDLGDILSSNTNMMEYLSTLGGLGLKERTLFSRILFRKFKAWWNVHFDTKLLNPYFWGSTIGHIPAVQLSLAWKWSRLSNT